MPVLSDEEETLFGAAPVTATLPAVLPAGTPAPSVVPAASGEAGVAPAPKPPRRMPIVDMPTPATELVAAFEAQPFPLPVATPELAAPPPCACGTAITPENGSRLRSGDWKHVGCPLGAPPVPGPVETTAVAAEQATTPKKRGRPPGAKNKPPEPQQITLEAVPVVTTTPPPSEPMPPLVSGETTIPFVQYATTKTDRSARAAAVPRSIADLLEAP